MQHLPSWARHPKALIVLVVGVIGLGLAAAFAMPAKSTVVPAEPTVEIPAESADAPPAEAPTTAPGIVVYVTGAVQAPETYMLAEGARVKDLVVAAGGFTKDADPDALNLASRLSDGQKVHVPRLGEAPAASATTTAAAPLLNLNTASLAELETLDGIGPAIAQKIVDYRAANGPFSAVSDLQKISGVGSSVVTKIESHVTVAP